MADTTDSKSVEGNFVRVQVPPSAPNFNNANLNASFNSFNSNLKFAFLFKINLEGDK